jgi:hypothetical protein
MKIVLHGFGAYPIVFRHLIEAARKTAPQLAWAVILPTPHHRDLMRAVLADDDILSLQDHSSRDIQPLADGHELAAYRGNIFSNIEAEKRAFKHRPAWQQLARAAETYRIYKSFLQRVQPSHMLVPQIEGYEGRMLPHLADELGIEAIVPTSARNLGGTFFSPDAMETLPAYRRADPAFVEAARRLVATFRTEGIPASGPSREIDPRDARLDDFRKPLSARTWEFATRSLSRPDLFEREYLRISLLNNLPWFRDALWWTRRQRGEREFDFAEINQPPARFIYYPLQVTPESSINTPAPYFVDQLRAVDAIRFAMPSDCMLVVKEHPSALATRAPGFVRALRRRAGIAVAHVAMDSRALIRRAGMTISVTGTATLEALLFGRPALTLGPSMIAGYLGGVASIGELRTRIAEHFDRAIPDDAVIRAVTEILSVRYDFLLRTPGLPGEPILRRQNIDRLLMALLDHIARSQSATRGAAT